MRLLALFSSLMIISALQLGCGPDYPKCDDSDDCRSSEKGKKEGRLICVRGLCQQCLKTADCGDPSKQCNAGRCESIPDYCTAASQCASGQKCIGNRCRPECASKSECQPGFKCDTGRCVRDVECTQNGDCGAGKICNAEGACVDKPVEKAACTVETVYFGYDEHSLSGDARTTLQNNAKCIKEENRSVRLEGHADERGSTEYNLALGERRARTVYNYLKSMGVTTSKMSTISFGEERPAQQCATADPDSCHRQNRRVNFTDQ